MHFQFEMINKIGKKFCSHLLEVLWRACPNVVDVIEQRVIFAFFWKFWKYTHFNKISKNFSSAPFLTSFPKNNKTKSTAEQRFLNDEARRCAVQ